MNNKPIIKLFEENELNVATLYSLYAQQLPENKAFWNRLSNEEISHAADIGNNMEHADTIIENKFSRGVINYVMDFVLNEIKKAQEEKITHRSALHSALRIERSILEKKMLRHVHPDESSSQESFFKT
jgi:hypothetical protein